jgi:hypothetical protein
VWSGTYGDGDAVIVEDEAGVGACKLAVRHGGNASEGRRAKRCAKYAAAAETKSVDTKRASQGL